jgi:hypothetical protein
MLPPFNLRKVILCRKTGKNSIVYQVHYDTTGFDTIATSGGLLLYQQWQVSHVVLI